MINLNNKLQVSLNNLDKTTKSTLNFFFSSGLCDKAELQSKNNNTDIYIIDLDRKFDKQVITNLKTNNQYAIIFHNKSSTPVLEGNTYSVTKPVKAKFLKQQIDRISLQLNKSESEPTITLDNTNKLANTFKPETVKQPLPKDKGKDKSEQVTILDSDNQLANNTEQEAIRQSLYEEAFKQAIIEEDVDQLTIELEREMEEHALQESKSVNKQVIAASYDYKLTKISEQKINTTSLNTNTKKNTNKNIHLNLALKSSTDLSVLNQYRAHKYVGSNKNIDPDNHEELEHIYLTPKKYIYHYLVKAVKLGRTKKSDVHIETLLGKFLFEYKTNLIYHKFDSTKLKFFKSSPLFIETEISLLKLKNIRSVKEDKPNTIDAEKLIWESAILASKGRVPHGTSLNQVVEMKSWPNYTGLLVFRYMIQITAAWSTHHLSLLDTAKQLNIPQRYIFTLFNAMLAIKCAKINNVLKKGDTTFTRKKKTIFSKILSHIFRH